MEEEPRNLDLRIAGEEVLHIVLVAGSRTVRTGAAGEERHSRRHMRVAAAHCNHLEDLAVSIQNWMMHSWGSGHSQRKTD